MPKFTKENARAMQQRATEKRLQREAAQRAEDGGARAATPTSEQGTDAERAAAALTPEPVEQPTIKRGPGRPPGRRPPSKPVVNVPEPVTPQEADFAGKQLQSVLNSIAATRGLPAFTDEQAAAAGMPAAMVIRKYASAAEKPEVALAFVLVPYALTCLRVEYERSVKPALERRRAALAESTGSHRDLREDGERQNVPREERFTTRPL